MLETRSLSRSQSSDMKILYRHYKGNEYELLGEATHSETGEELVVYKALYGEQRVWVRPKEMFFGTVKKGGIDVPRFEKFEGRTD